MASKQQKFDRARFQPRSSSRSSAPTDAGRRVEVWFGAVRRRAIRRGVFKSVRDLNTKIGTLIDGRNDRSHPLVWTKTAEVIIKKTNRPTTSYPRH